MAETVADTRRLITKPQNLNDAYGPPSNFLEIDVSNPQTVGVGRGRFTTYEIRVKVRPQNQLLGPRGPPRLRPAPHPTPQASRAALGCLVGCRCLGLEVPRLLGRPSVQGSRGRRGVRWLLEKREGRCSRPEGVGGAPGRDSK